MHEARAWVSAATRSAYRTTLRLRQGRRSYVVVESVIVETWGSGLRQVAFGPGHEMGDRASNAVHLKASTSMGNDSYRDRRVEGRIFQHEVDHSTGYCHRTSDRRPEKRSKEDSPKRRSNSHATDTDGLTNSWRVDASRVSGTPEAAVAPLTPRPTRVTTSARSRDPIVIGPSVALHAQSRQGRGARARPTSHHRLPISRTSTSSRVVVAYGAIIPGRARKRSDAQRHFSLLPAGAVRPPCSGRFLRATRRRRRDHFTQQHP